LHSFLPTMRLWGITQAARGSCVHRTMYHMLEDTGSTGYCVVRAWRAFVHCSAWRHTLMHTVPWCHILTYEHRLNPFHKYARMQCHARRHAAMHCTGTHSSGSKRSPRLHPLAFGRRHGVSHIGSAGDTPAKTRTHGFPLRSVTASPEEKGAVLLPRQGWVS
jgi:hypothetical protein